MDKYNLDGHKILWHLEKVADWQNGKIIAPIYVEISPISYCNHKCIFCGIDFARNTGYTLDKDVFMKRLKEMGRLGTRSVMFAGEGEPLLHKNLSELIAMTKKNGIDASLTTNGMLGTKKNWQNILPNLTWIRFSVDAGTSKIYQKVHCVDMNCFEKTIAAIKAAVEIKKEKKLKITIGIQFLIIEENIKDISTAIKIFSELGVDYLSLKPYSLHPQMKIKKNVVYSAAMIRYVQEIVNTYQGKMNIIFRRQTTEIYKNGDKNFYHCLALPFWGYISSNGDFYTCSVFIGDKRFKAGNIYKDDMKKIYFGNVRAKSLYFGAQSLDVQKECRINCRMARINEFLKGLKEIPEHVNFI